MDNHKSNLLEIEKRLDEIRQEKEMLLQQASEIEGGYLKSYEIRPAGRHLLTIGADLIQDQYAAIVELVKNCFDADSSYAKIVFQAIKDEDVLEIRVEDNGHGMSTKDVIEKWLVPSTPAKVGVRTSPSGRVMQGRKGIGRYAASLLGDDLTLHTVDSTGNETVISINWNDFLNHQYLDEIQIPINTFKTEKESGTTLIMHSQLSSNVYWTEITFQKLRFELKKLIPPRVENAVVDDFSIELSFVDYYSDEELNTTEKICPYPILDFYDYRISGIVRESGACDLLYENKRIKNSLDEKFSCDLGMTGCGNLSIDIRVYDRDKDSIESLIARGLRDERGNYVGKNQARQLLNEINGVGVYRNGFRIRPLGDADYDWLKLNEQRVQNPSMKIGSNQVVGYVHIESEESSGLEEKSARDGLKSNDAYENLKRVTCKIIGELEKRRFLFRRQIGLSKSTKKVERQLDSLNDYTELKETIALTLKKSGSSDEAVKKTIELVSQEEIKKNAAVEDIRKAIAIYQGQATLGKIINVIRHEGRRPLNYLKNQIPNLHLYGDVYSEKHDEDSLSEIIRLTKGIAEKADIFVELFRRIDPLAARRRDTKSIFIVKNALYSASDVFSSLCHEKNISINIECPNDLKFNGWQQDLNTILVNLIDNSIFWIDERGSEVREISISVVETENGFVLNYFDSGPGIDDALLISGVIFDPEFTTKQQGTGLGLAIAGEAATRNGLTLTAVHSDSGAHFVLSTEE